MDQIRKTIFFDFDGVICESVNVKTEAFRKMYLSYGEQFANRVVDHHISNGGISRFEKFKIYNGDWLGEEISDETIKLLAERFSSLVLEGVINSNYVNGALEFLQNSSEYDKYIITGTPTVEIREILKARGIDKFFLGAYGSPEKKPFWVDKIVKDKNLRIENCVFIGDAMADYDAAKCFNMSFILRNTPEGLNQFKFYDGPRVDDLSNLNIILKEFI